MPLDGNPADYTVETVPAEDIEAARVLRKAAEILDRRGLAKRAQCDKQGRVCIHGALGMAGNEGDPLLCYALNEFIISNFADGHEYLEKGSDSGVAMWNNALHRTKAEVIAALTGCAEWLENGREK